MKFEAQGALEREIKMIKLMNKSKTDNKNHNPMNFSDHTSDKHSTLSSFKNEANFLNIERTNLLDIIKSQQEEINRLKILNQPRNVRFLSGKAEILEDQNQLSHANPSKSDYKSTLYSDESTIFKYKNHDYGLSFGQSSTLEQTPRSNLSKSSKSSPPAEKIKKEDLLICAQNSEILRQLKLPDTGHFSRNETIIICSEDDTVTENFEVDIDILNDESLNRENLNFGVNRDHDSGLFLESGYSPDNFYKTKF